MKGLIRIVYGHAQSFMAIQRARRDAKLLLGADDRVLRDLGLHRCDVELALNLPITVDPTRVLAAWATERRLAHAENSRTLIDTLCRPPREPSPRPGCHPHDCAGR